jgi:hypothetical protein
MTPPECSIDECTKPARGRGWCEAHYADTAGTAIRSADGGRTRSRPARKPKRRWIRSRLISPSTRRIRVRSGCCDRSLNAAGPWMPPSPLAWSGCGLSTALASLDGGCRRVAVSAGRDQKRVRSAYFHEAVKVELAAQPARRGGRRRRLLQLSAQRSPRHHDRHAYDQPEQAGAERRALVSVASVWAVVLVPDPYFEEGVPAGCPGGRPSSPSWPRSPRRSARPQRHAKRAQEATRPPKRPPVPERRSEAENAL